MQSYPIAIRWADIDAHGHVNNVRILEYTVEAFHRQMLVAQNLGMLLPQVVFVHRETTYRNPLALGAACVRMTVDRIGFTSARFTVTVTQGKYHNAVTDTMTLVALDHENRPRPWTDQERGFFEGLG